MTFFSNRSRLWWYGLFLVDVGIVLWVIAVIDELTIPALNLLSTNDLVPMQDIGRLALLFALGFGSAATIGWGFTIMASSLNYTTEVRTYLLTGMTIWYILDGIASYLSEFYLNIVSNTLFLLSAIYVMFTIKIEL